MFKENKYTRWYHSIIDAARAREKENDVYYEKHHIVPKSMGGPNKALNIVSLTAKEHFVVHHLLTKMCVDPRDHSKMCNAFFAMHIHSTKNRHFTPRTYALSKSLMAEAKKNLVGELNHWFGKKHSEETKSKMKAKRVGRVCRNDTTVYHFHHAESGDMFCTQREMYEKHLRCKKQVNKLVKNKNKCTRLGWICVDEADTRSIAEVRRDIKLASNRSRLRSMRLVSPTGEVVDVVNVKKFAEDNGLSDSNLHKLFREKIYSYLGWTKWMQN